MHRIDTPTAMIDKFGQGKNGFTNGDTASGRRATQLTDSYWDAIQEEVCTAIESAGIVLDKSKHDQLSLAIKTIINDNALQKANNLSDVADKPRARANLALKGAALVDIGTVAGTAAAGDDTRIVGALQKSNNLGDITDRGTSRANLGLGTIATRDIGDASGQAIVMGLSLNANKGVGVDWRSNATPGFNGNMSSDQFPTLQVSNGGNSFASAAMLLTRGNYGFLFGIDSTDNALAIGGYSIPGRYRIYHEGYTGDLAKKPTSFISQNGWIRDATTGLIKQWGRALINGGGRITFPTSFITSSSSIILTVGSTASAVATFFNDDLQGFNVNINGGSGSFTVCWEATGF